MSRPTVNILVNNSLNDTPCTNPAGDANFILLGLGDILTWRDSQQMDGDLLTGVGYPPIIPESDSKESEKLFLMDYSAGNYKQVKLAGTTAGGGNGGNTRYPCAAWFSGATSTVPYLEIYDDDTHLTWASKPLGSGTPADSAFSAICTTNVAPGSSTWAGTPLAGTDSRIALDTAALSVSKYLYWNMKQILSSTMVSWDAADWYNADLVFSIHFTYS
jgi:hypothetical protein